MNTELPTTYFVTPEQHKFYEDNGYLVIKGLLDFASLYNYKQRFLQVCKGVVDRGSMTIVKEPSLVAKGLKGEELINKAHDIHFDDVFMTYTEHPRLVHVVSQFIGDQVRVTNSMFINKPPGSSSHPPHQDLFYFPFRPAEKIIAAWTAVDDVTVENGCLYVIPKSHKRNVLYAHGEDTKKLYHGILDPVVCAEPRSDLEMSPGDTVFFHPLLVHGSGPNTTQKYRKSITAHYANEHCHYIDVTGTVQQVVAEGVEAEARRRGYHQVSFADTWRFKSKAVPVVHAKL